MADLRAGIVGGKLEAELPSPVGLPRRPLEGDTVLREAAHVLLHLGGQKGEWHSGSVGQWDTPTMLRYVDGLKSQPSTNPTNKWFYTSLM